MKRIAFALVAGLLFGLGLAVSGMTNPDKVLYPMTGSRKRDVLAYYLGVAEVMLPHLADRPTTLVRWPDGRDDIVPGSKVER